MDIAWIQIFILTFAECVAPAGKTVCQEQQFELRFASKDDCEYARSQLIAMKDEMDNVIVDRQKSVCTPSAMEAGTYESLAAINEANKGTAGWRSPDATEMRREVVSKDHKDRLASLKSCEATRGAVPCKVGDIIVEEAGGDSVEVWRRD